MNLRNSKGISGIDVSISIAILVIFSAVIANMYINVNSAQKMVTRKAEATYVAINTIETLKDADYDDLDEGSYTLDELNNAIEGTLNIPDGYGVAIQIINYKTIKSDNTLDDVIKKAEVTVSYRDRNVDKNVKLETVLINGGE